MKALELAKPKGAVRERLEDLRTVAHEDAAMERVKTSPRLWERLEAAEWDNWRT